MDPCRLFEEGKMDSFGPLQEGCRSNMCTLLSTISQASKSHPSVVEINLISCELVSLFATDNYPHVGSSSLASDVPLSTV